VLENAGLADEDIDTIKSQKIVEGKLSDEEKVTIPDAIYEVSERYYDLTRYVNDVNTDNTEALQEYTQGGNLKSSHVYGNERIYSDIYDPVTEAFNVSNYSYDGRGSVIQTFTGTDVTSQLSYDPFGNLTSGEPAGSSYYGFNAEDTSGLTGLQYLRARYYDISDGRFITADDYLGDTEEPLTLNRYAYTANNPMKYVDPSGHFSLTKFTLNRFSNIDKRANILRTANNAFGKAIKTVTAISSLFMPQSTRKAYTTEKTRGRCFCLAW